MRLKCYRVLSGNDIVSHVACVSEEAKNFESCPKNYEENFVTHPKSNHCDTLVHTRAGYEISA